MMLKKVITLFAALLISFPLFAFDMEVKTGKINLVPVQDGNAADLFVVPMGKYVKGKFYIYHEKINGKHAVNGNAEFKNATDKSVFVVYYLALKDKKNNLICAVTGDLQVGVDNNIHQYASAIMPLAPTKFSEITNYEIVLYESFKPLGSDDVK